MILTTLHNLSTYDTVHPNFPEAFAYLLQLITVFDTLPLIWTSHTNEVLTSIKVDDRGKGKQLAVLESHKVYIDIQYTVKGSDLIGWKAFDSQMKGTGYDQKGDVEYFPNTTPDGWITVPAGSAVIFFPEDIHAPMACDATIQKIVIKVPLAK